MIAPKFVDMILLSWIDLHKVVLYDRCNIKSMIIYNPNLWPKAERKEILAVSVPQKWHDFVADGHVIWIPPQMCKSFINAVIAIVVAPQVNQLGNQQLRFNDNILRLIHNFLPDLHLQRTHGNFQEPRNANRSCWR